MAFIDSDRLIGDVWLASTLNEPAMKSLSTAKRKFTFQPIAELRNSPEVQLSVVKEFL